MTQFLFKHVLITSNNYDIGNHAFQKRGTCIWCVHVGSLTCGPKFNLKMLNVHV